MDRAVRQAANTKKRDTERLYFVRLHDSGSGRRIAIGNYWARDREQAVWYARLAYPGLFKDYDTTLQWTGMRIETQEITPIAGDSVISNRTPGAG